MYAVAQLVFVGAGFGFDGEGDSGLRQLYSRILDWRGLVSQCIASERVFQLRHRADIASVEFIHWYRSLTLHHRNMGKLFRCAAREVLNRGVILNYARKNFEVGDAAGEGIGNCFEYIQRNRLSISLMALRNVTVARCSRLSLHPLMFRWRGRVIHDEVEYPVCPDVPQSRTENDGENLIFTNGVMQCGDQVIFTQSSLIEKFLHQRIVTLGHLLH